MNSNPETKKELKYTEFIKNFGIDFTKITHTQKRYFLDICVSKFLHRRFDMGKQDDTDSEDEGERKPTPVRIVFMDQDFKVMSFKREYTGTQYRWPLTLSVKCLNKVPYGIKLGFFDIAKCKESCLFLAIYRGKRHQRGPRLTRFVDDWVSEGSNEYSILYDFLKKMGWNRILKTLVVDREGNISIKHIEATTRSEKSCYDSLERIFEMFMLGLNLRRRREQR